MGIDSNTAFAAKWLKNVYNFTAFATFFFKINHFYSFYSFYLTCDVKKVSIELQKLLKYIHGQYETKRGGMAHFLNIKVKAKMSCKIIVQNDEGIDSSTSHYFLPVLFY